MHRLGYKVAALVSTAALIASAAPASAATVSVTDPRGDAAARFDITRVTARNNDTVAVKSRIRNLRGGLEIYQANLTTAGTDGQTYLARTVHHRDGSVVAKLLAPDGSRVDCDVNGRWRLKRDTVKVSFAQDCLEEHGRLRVQAFIGAGNGSGGDPADWTKRVRAALR